MTNNEIIALMKKFRADAEEGNRATFQRMSKCERFKIGKQWDPDVKARMEAKRKFTLGINCILPTVLQITGTEVQNPRDIRFHHRKGGTKTIAKLLTALTKHSMDTSHAQRQKSQMFDDGVTTARGWIGADFDYSKDPVNADIIVKKYDPFAILPDPNRTHYDLNHPKGGAKFVIVDEWEDKDKVELQYPGKKNDLMNANYAAYTGQSWFGRLTSFVFDRTGPSGIQDDYRDHTNDEVEGLVSSKAKYNYRVSTYWWKQWKKGVYIQRLDQPLNYITLFKPADIKAARNIAAEHPDQVKLIDKNREGKPLTIGVLNKTKMVGDVLLDHEEDPFKGLHLFPVVLFSPYFHNGYEFGLVENLIGPQEQVNWSWSMELNLIKQLANAWWKVRSATARARQWLEDHGSEDGIVIEESKYGNKVEKGEPNAFPMGFDHITGKGIEHVARVSNVRLESPQTDKDRVAAAIRLKQASAFTGSATLFSNNDYTIELLGDLIGGLIAKMNPYSEEEIRAIIDEEELIDTEMLNEARLLVAQREERLGEEIPEPPQPSDQMMLQQLSPQEQQGIIGQFQIQLATYQQKTMQVIDRYARPMAVKMLLAEVKNLAKGRYGTKVSLAPMAETMRAVKTLQTFELNKVLIESQHKPLSRRTLIEAADPMNKEAILAEEGA